MEHNFLFDIWDWAAEAYIIDYLKQRPKERLDVLKELLMYEEKVLRPIAENSYVPIWGKGGLDAREEVIVVTSSSSAKRESQPSSQPELKGDDE